MEESELKTKIQHLEKEIEDLEKKLQNSIDAEKKELIDRIEAKKNELASTYTSLGHRFFFKFEFLNAQESFFIVTRLRPNDENAWYNLGLAFFRSKNFQEALNAFEKHLQINPSAFRGYWALAGCYIGFKELEKAKINFEKAETLINDKNSYREFQEDYKSFLHEYNNSSIKSTSENQLDFEAEILPFAVKRLAISDFQCIKNIDISLPADARFVFLLGQNGDGKTSILQALAIALHGAEGEAYQLLKENNQTKIGVEFLQAGENTIHNLYHADKAWKGIDKCKQAAGYSVKRLNRTNSLRAEWGKIEPFDNLYTENDEKLLNIERWLIDDYLENDEVTTWAKEIFGVLKNLMPSVEKVERKGSGIIYFEYGKETRFEQLSAGNKAIVSMIGDMLIRLIETQRETAANLADLSGIVLVDEIESHLHPSAQRELVFRLSQILPKVQFWFTTHSVFPLLGAPRESVFLRVRRENESGTSIEKLQIDTENLLPNTLFTSELFGMESIFSVLNKSIFDVDTGILYRSKEDKEAEDLEFERLLAELKKGKA